MLRRLSNDAGDFADERAFADAVEALTPPVTKPVTVKQTDPPGREATGKRTLKATTFFPGMVVQRTALRGGSEVDRRAAEERTLREHIQQRPQLALFLFRSLQRLTLKSDDITDVPLLPEPKLNRAYTLSQSSLHQFMIFVCARDAALKAYVDKLVPPKDTVKDTGATPTPMSSVTSQDTPSHDAEGGGGERQTRDPTHGLDASVAPAATPASVQALQDRDVHEAAAGEKVDVGACPPAVRGRSLKSFLESFVEEYTRSTRSVSFLKFVGTRNRGTEGREGEEDENAKWPEGGIYYKFLDEVVNLEALYSKTTAKPPRADPGVVTQRPRLFSLKYLPNNDEVAVMFERQKEPADKKEAATPHPSTELRGRWLEKSLFPDEAKRSQAQRDALSLSNAAKTAEALCKRVLSAATGAEASASLTKTHGKPHRVAKDKARGGRSAAKPAHSVMQHSEPTPMEWEAHEPRPDTFVAQSISPQAMGQHGPTSMAPHTTREQAHTTIPEACTNTTQVSASSSPTPP